MITSKQFKALQPFEEHFRTAAHDYIRGLYMKDVLVMEPIYNDLGYVLSNRNCNTCLLIMVKKLGEEYEKYKDRSNKRKATRGVKATGEN